MAGIMAYARRRRGQVSFSVTPHRAVGEQTGEHYMRSSGASHPPRGLQGVRYHAIGQCLRESLRISSSWCFRNSCQRSLSMSATHALESTVPQGPVLDMAIELSLAT